MRNEKHIHYSMAHHLPHYMTMDRIKAIPQDDYKCDYHHFLKVLTKLI